ncbi:hypothetical protein ARAQ110984_03270 [Arcobacter aquimarinus]
MKFKLSVDVTVDEIEIGFDKSALPIFITLKPSFAIPEVPSQKKFAGKLSVP